MPQMFISKYKTETCSNDTLTVEYICIKKKQSKKCKYPICEVQIWFEVNCV